MPASPVAISGNSGALIRNVAFPGSNQALEIAFSDGKIAEIRELDAAVEWVCLPPLVDKHVHANRAFTLAGRKPDSFEHAIALTLEMLGSFGRDQYRAHARKLFQRAFSHGTTGIRTHADLDGSTRLAAVQGTLDAAAEMAAKMQIEVVAFATQRLDPLAASARSLIAEALAAGASLIGAAPALYAEPKRSIDAVVELAIKHGAALDLHQDEHLNPELASVDYLADAAISNGLQGRLTLSHGCVLSVLEPSARKKIIEKLLRAQIEVVALPLTNLYLQDRGGGTPRQRGLTCVHEMLDAGIELRFASDNVCDAFYPYGDADLLDTLHAGMLGAQLDSIAALVKSVCDGRSKPHVGEPANLVLVQGADFSDILSRRPAERIIIQNGRPIELED